MPLGRHVYSIVIKKEKVLDDASYLNDGRTIERAMKLNSYSTSLFLLKQTSRALTMPETSFKRHKMTLKLLVLHVYSMLLD